MFKFLLILSAFVITLTSYAVERPEQVLNNDVGIFTQLGTQVDPSLRFATASGEAVSLQSLLAPNRPLLIVPVYFKCPRLCGLVMDGLVETLNNVSLKLGKDFAVAAVSLISVFLPGPETYAASPLHKLLPT